jgi:hypothetical protein
LNTTPRASPGWSAIIDPHDTVEEDPEETPGIDRDGALHLSFLPLDV